jgi:hypothetical protein
MVELVGGSDARQLRISSTTMNGDFQLMTTRFSVGIDLGTTNSAIALTDLACEAGTLRILPP